MLIIGEATYGADVADETARWHQMHGVWLGSDQTELPVGTPVVGRMAGESNELLLDGLIAGAWTKSTHEGKWKYEIPVVWSRHIVRGVRARDVLGEKGLVRNAHVGLDQAEWAAIQSARLAAG
jgi:hypothetical protein